MCNPNTKLDDYSKRSSSPPPAMQAGSDLYGSDGSEPGESNEANTNDNISKHDMKQKENHNGADKAKVVSLSTSIMNGILHGALWFVFAMIFPLILSSPEVRDIIYPKANYEYDPAISLFDNTILTYGTDYGIAAVTAGFAVWILITSNRSTRDEHKQLARASAAMLVFYSISTLAGAIAHQNFLTVESRNSTVFRLLWTICVGFVFLVPMAMGIIGNECLRIFQPRTNCPPLLKSMPRLTDTHWILYGAIGTTFCVMGYTSFQRPACDIFVAGCTQTPCTFYFMAFLYLVEHPGISKGMRIGGLVGFIQNAFLLPLYPVLVINLGFSLGVANAIMHANLCIAWSLQGLVLQRVVKCVVEESIDDGQHQENKILAKKVQ